MKRTLYEELADYSRRGILPMHMPGHKRSRVFAMGGVYEFENPYGLDVTEVTGLDNLHQPEGMIRQLMEQITEWYHSEQSYLLVNGSTGGILSAITACCRHGDRIAVARNCHKSVYHAIRLLELRPVYLEPKGEGGDQENLGIPGSIRREEVQQALQSYEDISCVILTSPTYEGIVSDIREIAQVTHRFHIPLVVDSAHGAHFNWHYAFPETALEAGADLVVESIHKTLPSFTQTALLHARFDRVERARLEWSLQTFQSSSPSYLLMAGIDRCFAYIQEEGKETFDQYVENLREFSAQMKELKQLYLFETPQKELSKLVIATDKNNLSGRELAEKLFHEYLIETEMSQGNYCLAMTSVCDEKENFNRLFEALHAIDSELSKAEGQEPINKKRTFRYMCGLPERFCYSYEAAACVSEPVRLSEASGRVAATDIYLYPPGVPMLVPGEVFSDKIIRTLSEGQKMGYEISGVDNGMVQVLKKSGIDKMD